MKLVSTTPRACRPEWDSWKPSLSRANGAKRKKERMVMTENKLMLSSEPCKRAKTSHHRAKKVATTDLADVI